MSLAALIAAQRADYGIPHTVSCRALGVSQAWFYKWRSGDGSPQRHRRKALAATIAWLFAKHRGTYGSPRITADLHDAGLAGERRTPSRQLMRRTESGGSPQRSAGAAHQAGQVRAQGPGSAAARLRPAGRAECGVVWVI